MRSDKSPTVIMAEQKSSTGTATGARGIESEPPGSTQSPSETRGEPKEQSEPVHESEETEPDEDEAETNELPLDQVFEILKNRRRREVLHYLEGNGGTASLSDLAEHIAAIENDTTVQALTSSQRKRVYVGLYQCHLPKMNNMDIVEFDKNRGTIELSSNNEQVKSYLEEPAERGWHRVYLGLTLAGGALFVAAEAGGAAYGLYPSLVLFGLLLALALCAVAHGGGLESLRSRSS